MSKTYEALKKAEAERERRAAGRGPLPSVVEELGQHTEAEPEISTTENEASTPSVLDINLKPQQAKPETIFSPETNGHAKPPSDLGIRPLSPNLEAQYQRL